MEQTYRAKLSATPHPPPQPNHNPPPAPPPEPHFNIPPQPPSMTYGGLAQAYYDGPRGAPVPIQLPNIYVNPYPPAPQQHEHVDEQPPRVPPQPLNGPTRRHERRHHDTIKLGSWHVKRPHPLLWLCFALSMLALVLEVPKGSLPTITGRHKALRTREKILEEKLHLLTHLSTFLPPPLSAIIAPEDPHDRRHLTTGHNAITGLNSLEGVYGTMIPSMRFWNTNLGTSLGIGADGAGRWWSVEELGAGASVVRGRSADNGIEKEVWVLRVGEGESEDKTLLNALTHSLLLRDRLQEEVATLRDASPTTSGTALTLKAGGPGQGQRSEEEREEWERVEEQRRKHKAREGEIDEREREVMRRERWVVEEMRKLSDKVHAQATELTLEDRITERLKAYQRQLATLHSEDHGTGLEHEHVDL